MTAWRGAAELMPLRWDRIPLRTSSLVLLIVLLKVLLTLIYEAALPATRLNLAVIHLAVVPAVATMLHVIMTIVAALLGLTFLTATMQFVCASLKVPTRFTTILRWATIASTATIAASATRLIFLLTLYTMPTVVQMQTIPGSLLYFERASGNGWAAALNLVNPFEVIWCAVIALCATAVTTRLKSWMIAILTWLIASVSELAPIVALQLLR